MATTEKKALQEGMSHHLAKAYGCESHVSLSPQGILTDYLPMKFVSFRVFFASHGTIFSNTILWVEQFIIVLIFVGCAIPVYYWFNKDGGTPGDDSVRKDLAEQETRMRDFAMIMTFLASLLLSFYTSIILARWWTIRTAGIGGIKAAAMELEMMISQMVTTEPQVLDAIRCYARASLILVFIWRSGRLGTVKQELVSAGLLTEQEANQLLSWNHCLHETIWAWQTAIVCTLHNEGKIKSDMLLRTLLERCSDGRKAVQVIHTHLAVKVPMQYIHLLGFLVKLHNVVLAAIMGCLCGAAVRNHQVIIVMQLAGRICILPLLFNAILLINAALADPFAGHLTDFPGYVYSAGLEKDGSSFIKASQYFPQWIGQRNPLPV